MPNSQLQQALPPMPLGISDWSRLSKGNMLIVDKTAKLWELVSAYDNVFIARPHGMGKSTMCSALYELFTHGGRYHAEANAAVYADWPEKQCYPVISLSFKHIFVGAHASEFEASLKAAVSNAFFAAGFPEVMHFDRSEIFSGFLGKFEKIALQHRLVVLIDDWDYPLSQSFGDQDAFALITATLRSFYVWLGEMPNLRFVLVTGTMHYRETATVLEGISFQDLSMDPDVAALLGYTQEEMETVFAPYIGLAAHRQAISAEALLHKLKLLYGGLCFDEDAAVKLYCPYSVNHFFAAVTSQSKEPYFGYYWKCSANTKAALEAYLQQYPLEHEELLQLVQHKFTLSYEELNLAPLCGPVSFKVLLVQAGYFALQDIVADSEVELAPQERSYNCVVPNHEVGKEFDLLLERYLMGYNAKKWLSTESVGIGSSPSLR